MQPWEIPTNLDFEADTLHKAIIKLHRLNAAQHSSEDDWHLNLMEATKDLTKEDDKFNFITYLSNPSGYKQNKKLWDELEDFDKKNTRKVIQKMVQPDELDWSNMKTDSKQVGATMYIHVKAPPPEEEDEKKEEPIDVD